MNFHSQDTRDNSEPITRIIPATENTIDDFVLTWVSDYLNRSSRTGECEWRFFPWEKVLRLSFLPINPLKCFAAYTEDRLDGMIAISSTERIKVELVATAPWNYYKWGTIRRIGKGLICFATTASMNIGKEGIIYLDAVPEAESFYRGLGMKETGRINDKNLKEFVMSQKAAQDLLSSFRPHIINN